MRLRLISSALALLLAFPAVAQTRIDVWPALADPVEDYELAIEMFHRGDRQVATCLFYRGQFRARLFVAARPGLPPDGAPALYASLNEVVGAEINLWAAGDVDKWAEAMECALRWAETTDDPQTPRVAHAAAHARVAGGLRDLITHVRSTADEIRAERAARGLENR